MMKIHTLGICALLVAAFVATAPAQTVPLISQETVLEYGGAAEYAFDLPADFNSARLNLAVRMDCPKTAGSTYVMMLEVNGQVVLPAADRSATRLLNKTLSFVMPGGLNLTWFAAPKWRVVYAPDFEAVTGYTMPDGLAEINPYRMVLDITDYLKPGEQNTLKISHTGKANALRQHFEEGTSLDFVFRELAVEFSDKPPVSGRMSSIPVSNPDTLMVDPPQPVDVPQTCTISDDGTLRMQLADGEIILRTQMSRPGGGNNFIGETAEKAAENLNVTVGRTSTGGRVTATADAYRMVRTIRLLDDHVEISDKYTNLRDEVTGIRITNFLETPQGAVRNAWLGGDDDPARDAAFGWENSSLYVEMENSGCGMVALDDVYRHQGVVYFDAGRAGIRTDQFGLAPNASWTLSYNIYPTMRPSYWDMINLARRDMDVNFTIQGGFSFFSPDWILKSSKEEIAEWLALRGIKILATGVWFDKETNPDISCYHGTHMLKATALQQKIRAASDRLHEWFPDIKVLVYIHSFINTDEVAADEYPEAKVTTADGKQYINEGYTKRLGVPFRYFYMTPDNGYLDGMKRVVDMCVDEDKLNADGCYWDEMAWISSRYTYDRWDGHTVDIDANGEVTRQYAHCGLIALEGKRQLAEYILDRGILIGNSCPTSETMSRLQFPRFAETAATWYPTRTHLYTPISLGDHTTVKDWPTLLADIRQKLDKGTLYYHYVRPEQPGPTVTQHMFPFTPVELHSGWLLGEERIVTHLSGTYTLGDDEAVSVYVYDDTGEVADSDVTEELRDGVRYVRLALNDDQMAVISRRGM